ncbi:MAG: AAA family ATPase [Phycisphaerae bacterium]|nr:AAA family ATPase [Phycisphaerae bacterium]
MDAILDGGYRRASCILITGAAGTGKSTMSATFTRAACQRGEKVLYANFEESPEAMLSAMLSPGIDLQVYVDNGTLNILTAMPESMGAEEHLLRTFEAIKAHQADHVIVDSLSSCQRFGSERIAFEFIVRLVNRCKECGATIILINQAEGFTNTQEISGIGISSIVDSVLALRHIDVGGEVNRMILVMKARGSKHSNQYREFLITDDGIDIADVYVGIGGALTGAARQEQEAKENAEWLLKRQQIERKEQELVKKQTTIEAEATIAREELAAADLEVEQLKLTESVLVNGSTRRGEMRHEDSDSERHRSGDKGGQE